MYHMYTRPPQQKELGCFEFTVTLPGDIDKGEWNKALEAFILLQEQFDKDLREAVKSRKGDVTSTGDWWNYEGKKK